MQTAAESQEVSNKTFLPEGMEKKLQALVRTSKTSASSSSAAVSSATAAGRKRKNDAGGANSATTPAKSKKAKAEAGTPKPKKPQPVRKRHAKSKLVTSPKTTTAAGPAEEMKPSERRRSGRQSTRVANYKEDLPSDDEGFEGEDDVSDVDQEMGDGTSSEQSESEHEFRPRRVSRGKTSVGGLARKLAVAATPKGKGKEKETDEMEVDGPEKDAEHENEEPAVAPVAPMASSAPTLQEEPTTLTVAVGRRPTRAAAGKAEASKSAPAPTRATRGAGKAVAAEDSDSSELSDVPDDVDEEEL